ncbi:MAG TPA: VgrG-related protein, partial [Acidimicrobiia bacterium]|nr:VgrG-related protein [Acidimicrobiia bacterium]
MIDKHRRGLVSIKVKGRPLPAAVLRALSEVRVEQSRNVPDAFTLRFNDHEGDRMADPSFDLGAELEIGVDVGGVVKPIMTGQVTGVAAELDGLNQQQFIVTGLDGRHRLTRGVKVRTFLNSTDADVVRKIASENGLTARVDASSTTYEYLLQSSSDYDFVAERARASGYQWWVEGKVLHFKRPGAAGASVTVKWGETLRRFRLRLSSAESAGDAEVRGWDPLQQRAVQVKAPMNGEALHTDAPLAAKRMGKAGTTFPAVRLAWGAPVRNISEAQTMAKTMAAKIGSEQAIAKGEVLGDPALRPGVTIDVTGLARPLCGKYRLSRVEHVIRAGDPYLTRFESGGASDHTLVDLLAGGGSRAAAVPGPAPLALGASLVVAVVTNKNDPDKLGRVKVKLSGVADQVESAWARVVSVGAGDTRGLQVIPDVGDEVLIGFEYGDVRRPLVIGGLWSGRHAHPKHPTSGAKDGAVWQTKGGHNLSMSDGSGAESYARLALASGKTSLRLGGDASSLETESDLTLDSAGAVTIKGKTDVTVEAQNITVEAGTKLVLEGSAG